MSALQESQASPHSWRMQYSYIEYIAFAWPWHMRIQILGCWQVELLKTQLVIFVTAEHASCTLSA